MPPVPPDVHALGKNEGRFLAGKPDDVGWELIWTDTQHECDTSNAREARDECGIGLLPRIPGGSYLTDHCIQLVDPSTTAGFLRARSISDMVDLELIQGWLERCAARHEGQCGPTSFHVPSHALSGEDFMVIDVRLRSLVMLPLNEEYVALSYVWGQTNFLTTSWETVVLR
jgi:hypothetical protein